MREQARERETHERKNICKCQTEKRAQESNGVENRRGRDQIRATQRRKYYQNTWYKVLSKDLVLSVVSMRS